MVPRKCMSERTWTRLRTRYVFTATALGVAFLYAYISRFEEASPEVADEVRRSEEAAWRRLDNNTGWESGWEEGMEHGYKCLSPEQRFTRDNSGLMIVPLWTVTMGGEDGKGCKSTQGPCLRDDLHWMIAIHVFLMFYMFLALAIVCDEFFVPALEAFVDYYKIPNDIAGATFMAAGGSMPELFTSFIATFDESAVGFAAIVGSAVFNVLFVIAVCALAADEPLELTWWPLARDCSFYLVGLLLVTLVFVGTTPKQIEFWEALMLFLWYFAYCGFMTVNERCEQWYKGKMSRPRIVPVAELPPEEKITQGFKVDGHSQPDVAKTDTAILAQKLALPQDTGSAHPPRSSTYRAGIGQLLTQHKGLLQTAGTSNVVQITGKIKEAWNSLADNEEGQTIGEKEFGKLVRALGWVPENPDEVGKAFNCVARDEKLTCEEFTKWYLVSKARVMAECRAIFKKFDVSGDGCIPGEEIRKVLIALGHRTSDEDLDGILTDVLESRAMESSSVPADKETLRTTRISCKEFALWYHRSAYSEADQQKHEMEAEEEEEGFKIDWPEGASWKQYIWYLVAYPLNAAMYCSLPDVRRPGMEGKVTWAIIEFLLSLVWIAVFSVILYESTVVTANTVGILPPIAGVTVLAAGTSIPDLLSSYIVARKGEGDMAVSSSIGSNIFDITVGLPLPWMTFIAVKSAQQGEMVSVKVEADSLGLSIVVLILMLGSVILSIVVMNWKMNKGLGLVMLVLYFVFIGQDLVRQLPLGDPLWKVNF
eukprot:TRINITY_DN2935_c1_g1_i1.p1 TRINITY_DN2935_c1_g1~~TRINITY_DN2935_c1_g1_i1.p1  ORF type:complete len:764 (-),score=168.81 TRINITY_DN2935_c1_g1_i1:162-2453(-)